MPKNPAASDRVDSDAIDSTGGAKVAAASKYGFHLHAQPYVGSSGSSDSIRFDTVVGGLNTIPEFPDPTSGVHSGTKV